MARSNITKQARELVERPQKYKKTDDPELLSHIKEVLKERASYGYKRVTVIVNGRLKKHPRRVINHKRVYRIMKAHNLLLQKPIKKPQRSHTGKVQTLFSNTRWCSDSFCIQCENGEQVHVAFSLDTCDREIMGYIASTIGIDGQAIRDLMLETVEYRFGGNKTTQAVQWLSDNGSCYVARETVAFGRTLGLDIRTTPVRSPESNGMAESLVKTLKRDYVWFGDLSSARVVMNQLPKWIEDYNERAPHKALNMLSPREFIREKRAS